MINPSLTEQTTALTDIFLMLVAWGCALWLASGRSNSPWRISLWQMMFVALGLAALAGAVVHGLMIPSRWIDAGWVVIMVLLGLAMLAFLLAVITDWLGHARAVSLTPTVVTGVLIFFVVSWLFSGRFIVVMGFELVCLMLALWVYSFRAAKQIPGSVTMLIALIVAVTAGVIQVFKLAHFHIVMPFDHNSSFHLLQAVAIGLMTKAVRA